VATRERGVPLLRFVLDRQLSTKEAWPSEQGTEYDDGGPAALEGRAVAVQVAGRAGYGLCRDGKGRCGDGL
jgi:hypothetical protein